MQSSGKYSTTALEMKATLVGAFLSIIGRIQGRYALCLVLRFLAANR
jgi:hypothetical protein